MPGLGFIAYLSLIRVQPTVQEPLSSSGSARSAFRRRRLRTTVTVQGAWAAT